MNCFRLVARLPFVHAPKFQIRPLTTMGPLFQVPKQSPAQGTQAKPAKEPATNHAIKSNLIKLINEEGELVGIQKTQHVLKTLDTEKFTLVQVTFEGTPTCKLMLKSEWLKQKKQKVKNSKNLSKLGQTKELALNNSMGDSDMLRKVDQGVKFLTKGYTVSVSLQNRLKDPVASQKLKEAVETGMRQAGTIHSQNRSPDRSVTYVWKPLDAK